MLTMTKDDAPTDAEYLTVAEAAAILRMPARSVTRLLKLGKLPGIYGGTRAGWRIRRSDLATWHTNKPRHAPAPEQGQEQRE